jgi:DNA repair protein RadC
MAVKRSPARHGRQSCEASKPARDSVGLQSRPFDAEPDGPAAAAAAAAAPAPADTERCRTLLAALLRRAWPDEAAAWADTLIAEFGSLPAALAIGTSDRARSIGGEAARFLGDIQAALLHCLRLPVAERPVISTSKQLIDYLQADMANLITERFRVLFLTSQNELLADDLIWEGTVGEAPAYPREIVKRALEVGATGIILVHNHPSGDPQPSGGDVDATRRIANAAFHLGICLHDHLIIARSGWTSFRRLGLLETVPKPE